MEMRVQGRRNNKVNLEEKGRQRSGKKRKAGRGRGWL